MFSTTAIVKNSKFSGRIVGTHQQLDRAARRILTRYLPRGQFFPTAREILHFEGVRGPDGLKRKSPDLDDPSHMLDDPEHQLVDQILNHYYNLVQALRQQNRERAAFEAAWLAHKVTDGLTPAHHYPLSSAKAELMTNKEFVKIFGEPIKGIMHGHNALETARNNWLYWGAGGVMTKHVAYEYGVAMLAAALPQKALLPLVGRSDFAATDPKVIFYQSLKIVQARHMYDRFLAEGWTTDLAYDTKDLLLPEIVKAIALTWHAAAVAAQSKAKQPAKLERPSKSEKPTESKQPGARDAC